MLLLLVGRRRCARVMIIIHQINSAAPSVFVCGVCGCSLMVVCCVRLFFVFSLGRPRLEGSRKREKVWSRVVGVQR